MSRQSLVCPLDRQDVFCNAPSLVSCSLQTSHFRSFAKRVNIMSFPFDLFQKVFAGGCAEGGIAGGGLATSTGDTSVELEDLLVNPTVN